MHSLLRRFSRGNSIDFVGIVGSLIVDRVDDGAGFGSSVFDASRWTSWSNATDGGAMKNARAPKGLSL